MELVNEQLLGQGAIGALTAVGSADPVVVAAIGPTLLTFDANRLTPKATSANGHADAITCLSADPRPASRKPSGHPFASGGADGRLIVWGLDKKSTPVASAELVLDAPIADLAWARGGPPGRAPTLAAALTDGRIALCWPGTERIEVWTASGAALRSLAWFPDGEHLAAAGEDGLLAIWRLPERSRAELLHHYNAISQVRVSACGRYVAFVSEDEKGAVFDLQRRDNSAFGEPADPVVRLAWRPGRPELVAGTQTGGALHFDAEQGSLEGVAGAGHLHPTMALCWTPDGQRAYSGGRDGRLISLGQREGAWRMFSTRDPAPMGYALSVAWAGEHDLAAGYSSGQVALWRRDSEKVYSPSLLEKAHTRPVHGLAVSPNHKAVASGAVDGRIKIWDVAEGLQAYDLGEVHNKPIYGVAFAPSGKYLATGSGDTYLVIYDIQEVKKKAQEAFGKDEYWHFAVRNRILNCVAWSPRGKTIAVGLSNHKVVLLPVTADGQVSKGPTLAAHDDAVSAVAFSRDGRRLVSVGYDRRIVVWDLSGDAPRLERQRVVEHAEPIQALAVHPQGSPIATGSWDGTIRMWSASDLTGLCAVTGPHYSAVEDLAFDAGGDRLASASSDGTLGIWRLKGHPGA